jgi:hypothetical protein
MSGGPDAREVMDLWGMSCGGRGAMYEADSRVRIVDERTTDRIVRPTLRQQRAAGSRGRW